MIDNLFKFVIKTNSCWNWEGWKRGGYGMCWYKGKSHSAHRIFYTLFKGRIPKRMQIDHICRNRGCVNPKHLEVVTASENTQRHWDRKGRKLMCGHGHRMNDKNIIWIKDPKLPNKKPWRSCRKCRYLSNIRWRNK